ncbi:MAG: 4Fe-4S binding protein, partial [Candidatus Hermodarchaeota archaeon]
ELQQHLDNVTIGFPPTKSGVEIRLLKHLFTHEEAKIALYLRFSWKDLEPLEDIYNRIKIEGYSINELENHLDRMAKKGAIMALKKGDSKTYGNANFIVGMSDYQVNKLTRRFFKDSLKYLYEAYLKELGKNPIPQMRVIPVEQTLEIEKEMVTYDDLKIILDNAEGPYMVTNCVCRQGRDLLNDPCKVTKRREICLSFGYAAQRYLGQGWGREISKEEALIILKKNDEEGLIHQINNAQKPDFICSCCPCCDEGLKILKSLPNPGQLIKSNYFSKIDSELCTGCGTCLEHCQMDAIVPKNNIFTIIKKRCIGCGNCVNYCPSNAIQFKKKRTIYIPPATGGDLYNEIINMKEKVKNKK